MANYDEDMVDFSDEISFGGDSIEEYDDDDAQINFGPHDEDDYDSYEDDEDDYDEEKSGLSLKSIILYAIIAIFVIGVILVSMGVLSPKNEENTAPAVPTTVETETPVNATKSPETDEKTDSSTGNNKSNETTSNSLKPATKDSSNDQKENEETSLSLGSKNVDSMDLSLIGVNGQGDTDSGSGLIQAYDYAFYTLRDAEKASSYAVDNPLWSAEVLEATITRIPPNLEYSLDINRLNETEYDVTLHLSRDGKKKSFKQKYTIVEDNGELKIQDKIDYGPQG